MGFTAFLILYFIFRGELGRLDPLIPPLGRDEGILESLPGAPRGNRRYRRASARVDTATRAQRAKGGSRGQGWEVNGTRDSEDRLPSFNPNNI